MQGKKFGLFSLEKRRFHGDLIAASQQSKGAYKKDEDRLCSRACCDRTRSNDFKLVEGRFRLCVKKKFFTMGVETLEQVAWRDGKCPIQYANFYVHASNFYLVAVEDLYYAVSFSW